MYIKAKQSTKRNIYIYIYIVTVDPGSKPDQNLCSAERHAKVREKEFRLCTVHWYIVSV